MAIDHWTCIVETLLIGTGAGEAIVTKFEVETGCPFFFFFHEDIVLFNNYEDTWHFLSFESFHINTIIHQIFIKCLPFS